ncbi:hypothetical protein [Streptomyces iconiensis]|uniref:Uncharacterized protein n=1 Tax=Streptomyces iconiensis TaxID=1384038 RepID=A0ABT6ZVD3_9ACTN|nr:hypothetical protein [Streptomyces iconiensis]MDJ1132759.1 hypothetical protein [Streptomyces iconiensis]
MTDGKGPGLVRFYLACDAADCGTRAVFDLVIETSPPPIEEDVIGHITHSGAEAADYIKEQGWTFIQTFGYFCPTCSTPRSERRATPPTARRAAPQRRTRRAPKRP